MEWEDLRYVLAVSRAQTLTRAACELGVTRTTVGRRLRSCEERLGVRLFDRTPDGWVVTAAGQDLTEVAERVENEVLLAQGRVLGRDAELRGGLRVSVFDFALYAFDGAFTSFLERYPSVELTITSSLDAVNLSRREADVALRLTSTPSESLIGRRIGEVPFAVYGSNTLIERAGPGAGYSDFPWIAWDERLNGQWIPDWLAKNAPGAKIGVRIDENAILRRQAIAAGMGVFFLPCFEGDAMSGIQRLGPIEFHQPLWLLTLPDLKHTLRVRAFMEHMAPLLKAQILGS